MRYVLQGIRREGFVRYVRFRVAWWLEGCSWPEDWQKGDKVPWRYRLGMRIMP